MHQHPETPNVGYRRETTRNDLIIDVATGETRLRVDGGDESLLPTNVLKSITSNISRVSIDAVNRKLIIDPCMDLDLSNSYHIEIDAGAFTNAQGVGNAAISSASEISFSTVLPAVTSGGNNTANKAGALSQTMTEAGGLSAGYHWIDLLGRGTPTNGALMATNIFDAGIKKYAFAFADQTQSGGLLTSEFLVRVYNFGADDLIYIDSQGDGYNVTPPTITETATQPWTVPEAPDYVNVSVSGVGSSVAAESPSNPPRAYGRFSTAGDQGSGGEIRLSLDPGLPNLIVPDNSARDSLADIQVAPLSILDLNTKLHGGEAPVLGVNGNWLDPNNTALYVVLG
jgi:hypothetical protein